MSPPFPAPRPSWAQSGVSVHEKTRLGPWARQAGCGQRAPGAAGWGGRTAPGAGVFALRGGCFPGGPSRRRADPGGHWAGGPPARLCPPTWRGRGGPAAPERPHAAGTNQQAGCPPAPRRPVPRRGPGASSPSAGAAGAAGRGLAGPGGPGEERRACPAGGPGERDSQKNAGSAEAVHFRDFPVTRNRCSVWAGGLRRRAWGGWAG